MNIYEKKPPMVAIEKTYTDYVTAIHMDVRELTQEERVEHEIPDTVIDEEGVEHLVEAWTAADYFLRHETPEPDIEQLREVIENHINAKVDANILCGYEWTVLHGDDAGKTVKVWLSKENQDNFKAKHDAALVYPDRVRFPMTYKISEVNHKAVYEVFDSIQELAAFYLGGLAYIEACYNAGWAEKDAIDYDHLLGGG